MCKGAEEEEPQLLKLVLKQFRTKEFQQSRREDKYLFEFVPNHQNIQKNVQQGSKKNVHDMIYMFLNVAYGYRKCGMRTSCVPRLQSLRYIISLFRGVMTIKNK